MATIFFSLLTQMFPYIGSFTPYYVDLGDSLQSLDADSSSDLQLTLNEERILKEQMDMCANEPHAFVYPPHSDA